MNRKALDPNIVSLAEQMQELPKKAHKQYVTEVDKLIQNKITDQNQIQNLMDRMLDFCFDDALLLQFKKLCRYYYKINPPATAEYIQFYRELWDNEQDEANNE
ncbi:hypothetical protein H8E88_09760 [candidate division KSB1 bacterium]|nr:hypothetical protein [candidate division KSB1 bacterium]MBL7094178.1 hypothetical protein [candidate division KSB1 bacterium]